jgi:hypothetical protein
MCVTVCTAGWLECVECADVTECVDNAVCGEVGICSSAPALARRRLRACSDSEAMGSTTDGELLDTALA